jgi:Acetyltransferase (GNAT) domain
MVLTLHERDELRGVAPFYRAGRARVQRLRIIGHSGSDWVTELPEPLFDPSITRKGLRTVVEYLAERSDEWDWVDLILSPEHGWFEPQWIPRPRLGAGCFVMERQAIKAVVLPLPHTWEELRCHLKTNVKESIRRSFNRLGRDGKRWRLIVPANAADLGEALDKVVELHRARATMRARRAHEDYVRDPRAVDFLRSAASPMFERGELVPHLLEVDGQIVAGRLTLRANGALFFGLSGFDPNWWSYGPATTLLVASLQNAIDDGLASAILGTGLDFAKLRWSEQIHSHQGFTLVSGRRGARLKFALFWQLQAASALRQSSRAQGARQ